MQSSVAQERRRQFSLTQERLKEVLQYFPTTGRFRWLVRQAPWTGDGKRGLDATAGITRSKSTECVIIRIVLRGSMFTANTLFDTMLRLLSG